MVYPDFGTFSDMARQGNLIPVYREILGDLETPVSAYKKLRGEGCSFLLESVEGGEKWVRFSFLGLNPSLMFQVEGGATVIHRQGRQETLDPAVDPFRWREKLPFARWGLAELQLMGYPLLALAIVGAWFAWYWAVVPGVLLGLVVYFFRDPRRHVPEGPGLLISTADGTVAEITAIEHDDFIAGPAVRIGIFLSIFNVHINRAPAESRVIRARYSPGQFLNAMNPESAIRNENLWIGLEEGSPPHRRLVVRQIAGLIARRIVCNLRSGELVARGHKFGMIKLGSRTELIFPAEAGLQVLANVGDKVQGGSTVLARYADT